METLYVRLKPFAPERGHVLRRYTCRGIRFREAGGWQRVPHEVTAYLRGVRQQPGDPRSPLAFDVCAQLGADAEPVVAGDRAGQPAPHVAARGQGRTRFIEGVPPRLRTRSRIASSPRLHG